jgi:hypothetical protein
MKFKVAFCFLGTLILSSLVSSGGRGEAGPPTSSPGEPVEFQRAKFSRAMTDGMRRMDGEMMGAPATGGPDHDFSAMMIPHHQGAVDMAKAVIPYGRDPAGAQSKRRFLLITEVGRTAPEIVEIKDSSLGP